MEVFRRRNIKRLVACWFCLQVNHLLSSMIEYSEKDGTLTFKVQVVPRASRNEIVGEHNGALRVRIAAPPVDGAANEELVRTLSRALGVKRGAIEITSGLASKTKQVRIDGVSQPDLQKLLIKQ